MHQGTVGPRLAGKGTQAQGSVASSTGVLWRRRLMKVGAEGLGKLRRSPTLPTIPSSGSSSGTSSARARTCISFNCRVEEGV